jgi:type IV pilus assembly protein PilN
MKLSLNLASRSYLNRRALYAFYAALIAVLVLLLMLNFGFFLRGQSQARQLKARLAEFDQELAGRQEVARDFNPAAYDRLLAEIAFANEILVKDGFRWTALLDRLEEVVPKKVIIRGIQPDYKGGSLSLPGQARRVADLRLFLDNLIHSPDFSDVYLLQQSRESTRGAKGGRAPEEEGINFTIVVKGAF